MKKNIILLVAIILYAISANCQLEKRNWLIGGTVSYNREKLNSDLGQHNDYYQIKVYPKIGFFVANKFSLGLVGGYSNGGGKSIGTTSWSTYKEFSLGTFARYYLLQFEKEYNIVSEVSYQYGTTSSQVSRISTKNIFSLSAGPVIYFNSCVGLEFLIGYSTYINKGYAGSNTTVQMGLGLQVHLKKD